MTQPSLPLELSTERREKKRGHVPRTSVLAYKETKADFRIGKVALGLTLWNVAGEFPTSAELTKGWLDCPGDSWMERLLFVRRGLSDGKARGLVEHVPHGERMCRVTGRKSVVWRVKGR